MHCIYTVPDKTVIRPLYIIDDTSSKITLPSGNKVILAYDEEDLEDEDTNINKVLKDVRTFCFEQSRSSKATSKVAQNFLKKGGNQSDLEDELDDANIEVDAIYRTAILNGYGDPKKPFAYKASIK